MTALVLAARRPRDPLADDGFEVSYVPDGGAEHRVPLVQASAVPLEQGGDGCLQPPVPTLTVKIEPSKESPFSTSPSSRQVPIAQCCWPMQALV